MSIQTDLEKSDFEEGSKTERSTLSFKLAWFIFFSLGSLALTLAALFGCSSNATQNLYIARMDPAAILNSTKPYLTMTQSSNNATNTTTIPDYQFFTPHPLPFRYLVGISGVCRQYSSSDISNPIITTNCTRQLHPRFDLLALIEQDIPNASTDAQFKNWQLLLNDVSPNFESDNGPVNARLTKAASALAITSVIWVVFTIILTLLVPRMYPRGAILLDIIDAAMMISASIMLTVVCSNVNSAYTGNDGVGLVDSGPGFYVLWAVGFAKLAVTPVMLWAQVVAILTAIATTLAAFLCCFSCMARCLSPPVEVVVVEEAWY